MLGLLTRLSSQGRALYSGCDCSTDQAVTAQLIKQGLLN